LVENIFPPHLSFEIFQQNSQFVLKELTQYMLLIKAVLCFLTFILGWCMHIQIKLLWWRCKEYVERKAALDKSALSKDVLNAHILREC
jgi:hypothetical protein